MDAARVFSLGPHVGRVVLALRARGTGCGERPVVGVHDPAVGRIEQGDGVFDGVCALPFGCRIAAVHRAGEIKFQVTPGNEIAVKISDAAVGVRIDSIVGSVGAQLLGLAKRCIVSGLGAQVRLFQRRHRILQQPDRDPLVVLGTDDRSVMAVIHGEVARHQLAVLPEGDGEVRDFQRSQLLAISVEKPTGFIDDGFGIFIDRIAAVGSVHPAVVRIEPLVDEELPPGRGAIDVQPLLADHLQFGAEIV